MLIQYRTPPGSGEWLTLADEDPLNANGTSDRISLYKPSLGKSPQREALAFSADTFVADRGNALWEVSFTVDREHASADAALKFVATHGLIFTAQPSATASTNFDLAISLAEHQKVYMPDCAVVRAEPDAHSDRSTRFSYQFTGPRYNRTGV